MAKPYNFQSNEQLQGEPLCSYNLITLFCFEVHFINIFFQFSKFQRSIDFKEPKSLIPYNIHGILIKTNNVEVLCVLRKTFALLLVTLLFCPLTSV